MAYNTIKLAQRHQRRLIPRFGNRHAHRHDGRQRVFDTARMAERDHRRRRRRREHARRSVPGLFLRVVAYALFIIVFTPLCVIALQHGHLKAGLVPMPVLVVAAFLLLMNWQELRRCRRIG